jgi:hypothetical protein
VTRFSRSKCRQKRSAALYPHPETRHSPRHSPLGYPGSFDHQRTIP